MTWHPHPEWSAPGMLYTFKGSTSGPTVLLTHGTFSNIHTLAPLAATLNAAGLRVYGIEWRNRTARPGTFTYNDIARDEIAQAIGVLAEQSDIHLMGHSGGALAMILAMHQNADLRRRVRSLTCLAAQATHQYQASLVFRTSLRLMNQFGRLFGYWPVRITGLGPCNESAALQAQWMRWNDQGAMTDAQGNDVYAGLRDWGLPVLAVAAQKDTDIAPTDGCRLLADAFGASSQFHVATRVSDGEDFTHSRLVRSRAAQAKLWPRIIDFIKRQEGG